MFHENVRIFTHSAFFYDVGYSDARFLPCVQELRFCFHMRKDFEDKFFARRFDDTCKRSTGGKSNADLLSPELFVR